MAKTSKSTNVYERTVMEYQTAKDQVAETKEKLQEISEKIAYERCYLEFDSDMNAVDLKKHCGATIETARDVCRQELKRCKEHPNAKQIRLLQQEQKEQYAHLRIQETKVFILEGIVSKMLENPEGMGQSRHGFVAMQFI
jgi:hypothetical protein